MSRGVDGVRFDENNNEGFGGGKAGIDKNLYDVEWHLELGRGEHDFLIIPNGGSGDCMFKAVSQAVYNGDESRHKEIREKVVNFIISERWEKFQEFIEVQHINGNTLLQRQWAKDPKQTYKMYMSLPGTLGSSSELTGAAELYGYNFATVQEYCQSETERTYRIESCFLFGTSRERSPFHYFYFTGDFDNGHWEYIKILTRRKLVDGTYRGKHTIYLNGEEITPEEWLQLEMENNSNNNNNNCATDEHRLMLKESIQFKGDREPTFQSERPMHQRRHELDPRAGRAGSSYSFASEDSFEKHSVEKIFDGLDELRRSGRSPHRVMTSVSSRKTHFQSHAGKGRPITTTTSGYAYLDSDHSSKSRTTANSRRSSHSRLNDNVNELTHSYMDVDTDRSSVRRMKNYRMANKKPSSELAKTERVSSAFSYVERDNDQASVKRIKVSPNLSNLKSEFIKGNDIPPASTSSNLLRKVLSGITSSFKWVSRSIKKAVHKRYLRYQRSTTFFSFEVTASAGAKKEKDKPADSDRGKETDAAKL